jgi:nitroreductase/NAD-dependent dihydropyrimidine dehydrogenase PreA subunit
MNLVKIDSKRCIKCGMCVSVCPVEVLSMNENCPVANNPQVCIACGHCVAVCPREALDNLKTPLAKQKAITKFPVLDAKIAEEFLRSRRSIRCYKNSKVSREKLLELLNITRFAQTAGNSQGMSYVIIDNKDILKKATSLVIDWMTSQGDKSPHVIFPLFVKAYREAGRDTVLRDAPALILGMADSNSKQGRESTVLSFAYLELFAPSLGLGSCWAGLLELAIFTGYQPLLELLNFPEDKKFTGAMMVGYPKYTYKRLVDRNPLDVTWMAS